MTYAIDGVWGLVCNGGSGPERRVLRETRVLRKRRVLTGSRGMRVSRCSGVSREKERDDSEGVALLRCFAFRFACRAKMCASQLTKNSCVMV